eukprot:SAG22_NODE_13128_length_417_cov_5.031447_1_plen_97_part_01
MPLNSKGHNLAPAQLTPRSSERPGRQIRRVHLAKRLWLTSASAVAQTISVRSLRQPLAFLSVFYAYGCDLEPLQVWFGLVVAAREVLYLATTLAGVV